MILRSLNVGQTAKMRTSGMMGVVTTFANNSFYLCNILYCCFVLQYCIAKYVGNVWQNCAPLPEEELLPTH